MDDIFHKRADFELVVTLEPLLGPEFRVTVHYEIQHGDVPSQDQALVYRIWRRDTGAEIDFADLSPEQRGAIWQAGDYELFGGEK